MTRHARWAGLLATVFAALSAPALAQQTTTYQVLDANGLLAPWPAPIEPLEQLDPLAPGGAKRLLAQRSDTRELGIVMPNGQWQSLGPPGQPHHIDRTGELIQIATDDKPAPVLFRNGKWSSRKYRSRAHGLGSGFMLAEREEGEIFDLLHGSGKVLISGLPMRQARTLRVEGDNAFVSRGDTVWLHALHDKPRPLGPAFDDTRAIGHHIVLYEQSGRIIGVAPHSGQGLRTDARWRAVAEVTDHNGTLWATDSQHAPVLLIRPDGRQLLTPDVRARLGTMHLRPAYESDPETERHSPIVAHILEDSCPCSSAIHGALLDNGQLLLNTKWTNIRWLGRVPEGAAGQSGHRFAIQADGAWSMADARGRVITRQTYDAMQPMRHGLVVAAREGRFELLDASGRAVPLPDMLDVQVMSGNVLAYLPVGDTQGLWGLYDIQRGATVVPPRYAAIAQLAEGLWTARENTADGDRWTLLDKAGTPLQRDLNPPPRMAASWAPVISHQPDGRLETLLYRGRDGHRITLPGAWRPEPMGDLLVLSTRSVSR